MPALGQADHPAFWCSVATAPPPPSQPQPGVLRPLCRRRGAWTSHHTACLCADLSASGVLSPSISHTPPVNDVQATLPPKISTRSDSTFVGIHKGEPQWRGPSLLGSLMGSPTCDDHISQVPLGPIKPPSKFPAPLQTPVLMEAG